MGSVCALHGERALTLQKHKQEAEAPAHCPCGVAGDLRTARILPSGLLLAETQPSFQAKHENSVF